MSNTGWFTRFPPSDAALLACQETISTWTQEQEIDLNLEETIWKLAARVNSWLSPASVKAGVLDLLGARLRNANVPAEQIDILSDRLARRLLTEGLLGRPVIARAQSRPEG